MSEKTYQWTIKIISRSSKDKTLDLNGVTKDWTEGKFRKRVCSITTRLGEKEYMTQADDYFTAFCQLRENLSEIGITPYCYASSLNVYPSGMARDMAAGLKAYQFTHGFHVSSQDLVHIFDTGEDVTPVSVAEQKAYFDEWLKSPRV